MPLFLLLGVVMMAAVALLALGWIAPLIVGLALRSRKTGHPRAWLIAAGVWGGLALLLGVTFAIAAMNEGGIFGGASQISEPAADAPPVTGPKATLRFDGMKTASLTVVSDKQRRSTYAATNGTMILPSGRLRVERLVMTAVDGRGRTWTASGMWYGGRPFDLKEGEQKAAPWLPPFAAGIKLTASGVSDAIEAEPVYAVADGAEITLAGPGRAKEDTPFFEAFDAAGKSVMRGTFEYG